MILSFGKIYDDSQQSKIISELSDSLYLPLIEGKSLEADTVISACDTLSKRVINGEFDSLVTPYLELLSISNDEFIEMAKLFSRSSLEYKVSIELSDEEKLIGGQFTRKRYPLGVLLHIAAGNVDVLPAYSVIEGLLAGNINILKLPAGDSGLSVKLLSELISIEPQLADYIHVFDVPSTELDTIKQLADYSDAIVVWGGDSAVAAARKLASVSTKIISWGHKLSFAYASTDADDEQLYNLAKHICTTNQLLCSSCQGIYVDTDSKAEQLEFAKRFFKAFRQANKDCGEADFGMRAKNAISIYNERLEQHATGNTIFSENGVSVICSDDSELKLSYMYRNVWIKRLPHSKIIKTLKPYKSYLQTAGVMCNDAEKRKQIYSLLANAGLVRITNSKDMSRTVSGEAHDGCYALREYSRIVECV